MAHVEGSGTGAVTLLNVKSSTATPGMFPGRTVVSFSVVGRCPRRASSMSDQIGRRLCSCRAPRDRSRVVTLFRKGAWTWRVVR
jgi:hypothetical protein